MSANNAKEEWLNEKYADSINEKLQSEHKCSRWALKR